MLLMGGCSGSSSLEENGTNFLKLPVDGSFSEVVISDSFGPRILNGSYDFHRGLDILRHLNDPIYASDDGVVIHTGTLDGFSLSGIFVILEHDDNLFTGYLHLNSVAEGLNIGDRVVAGETIGYAGMTGENINFVHLHFNVYQNSQSGEIPDDTDETSPPLEFLEYSDTADHTVEISNVNTEGISHVQVTLETTTPASEMDLNEVTLLLTSNSGETVYEKEVNFSERTNCGTDEDEVNSIQITPEDFLPPDDTYETTFTFKDIDLSAWTSLSLTITATATDIRGNQKTDTQTLELP